jgi:predicted  nucleic acid-binding Zn-ribbon protein
LKITIKGGHQMAVKDNKRAIQLTRELAQLEDRIREKRELLLNLTIQAGELSMTVNDLLPKVMELQTCVDRAVEKWGR